MITPRKRGADLTPETRALRARAGRLGAYAQQAQNDTRETTKAAREAFNQRFLNLVDPKHQLPEAGRQRRADAARKLFYIRLSMKGLATRRSRRKHIAAQATQDVPELADASTRPSAAGPSAPA
jgi:hypothetical protein